MNEEQAKQIAFDLLEKVPVLTLSTVDTDGKPDCRAMMKVENDGFDVWMATHADSHKMKQIEKDPRGCVLLYDMEGVNSLQIYGNLEIHDDMETKKRLWREQFKAYFPEGAEDPGYVPLKISGTEIHVVSGEADFKLNT